MLRRIFSRKTLIRTGIVVVLLAVLVAIFYAVENWRGRRAWDRYRADAEKRGVKLFLKDFIPPDIPDAENYAAAPIIREMFLAKADDRRPGPFSLPAIPPRTATMPRPPNDLTGQRFDAAGLQEFFFKGGLIATKSDSPAADILRAMETYEPALNQIRDASPRPKCKFPTQWERGAMAPLEHLNGFRQVSRLFALGASARLHLGDSAAALVELRHLLRMHGALRSELSLLASLVRLSMLDLSQRAVWEGLAAGQWRDGELAELEQEYAALRLGEDCRFAIMSERGFSNAFLLEFAQRGSSMIEEMMQPMRDFGMAEQLSTWQRLRVDALPRGWIFHLIVHTNRYYDWLQSQLAPTSGGADSEFTSAVLRSSEWHDADPPPLELEELFGAMNLPFSNIVDSVYAKHLHAHTRTQETRIACALERFRLAEGAFPGKLEPLVPRFLPALPVDIFDGKPLRYRVNADGGYDLWSIGPDGKDDGGKIDPKKEGSKQADWIWHMPGRAGAP